MADLTYNAESVPVTLGGTDGKTNVLKTGTLVTTAVTAGQVVLTYTVTAAKTFFLEYMEWEAYLTNLPGNANPIALGAISLETPSGTKCITSQLFHPPTSGVVFTFAEPVPIAAGVVVRVVVTPATATSMTWGANFGGYER